MKLKHVTAAHATYKRGPKEGKPIEFVVCEPCLMAHALEENGDTIRDATVEDGRPALFGESPPLCSYCGEEDPDLTQAWEDRQ